MSFVDGATEGQTAGFADAPTSNPMGNAAMIDPQSFVSKAWGFVRFPAEAVRQQLNRVRPWSQFFDREQFASPEGFGDAVSRLRCNVVHFYHNYFVVALLGSLIVLIVNPMFSICMFLMLLMWAYTHKKQMEAAETNVNHLLIGNYEISFSKAYILISIFGIISFFLFNGSSVMFWMFFASLGVATVHAVLRKPHSENELAHFV